MRRLKKKYKILFAIILSTIILLVINPFLSLQISNRQLTLEVYSDFIDDYKAYNFGKEISSKVKIEGNIDTTKLGTYKLTYTVRTLLSKRKETRVVNIVDTTSPTLTLTNPIYTLALNSVYRDRGFEVSDNYDVLTKENVIVSGIVDSTKEGVYTVTYTVKDSSNNETTAIRKVTVKKRDVGYINIIKGPTFIDGILIVNKQYSIPKEYKSDLADEALTKLKEMQAAAKQSGYTISITSGYRSYDSQNIIYNNYVQSYGKSYADAYAARPGHSEHQTGLAFDLGESSVNQESWLIKNCHKYGFILRYQKGKEDITGYNYESWHYRYVGVEAATYIMGNELSLEEYLGV